MDKKEVLRQLAKEGKVTVKQPVSVVVYLNKELNGELGVEIHLETGQIVYLSRTTSFWKDIIE